MKSKLSLFIMSFILLINVNVYGQFEQGLESSTEDHLTGIQIDTNATITQIYSSASEDSNRIKNIIVFKLNEYSNTFFASSFSATIQFTVNKWQQIGGSQETETRTLQVSFDTTTGSKYTARSYITYDNYQKVEVVINSILVTGNSGWDPLPELQIENEMRVLRYYTLSNNSTILTPGFLSAIDKVDAVGVAWTWDPSLHNNMNQLEWAWVEDETEEYYFDGSVINTDRLFFDNSTRVELDLDSNHYEIPLLYDGVGTLYYRVRAVHRSNNGSVITGPWSAAQTFEFEGHEPSLNWQSSTSFAENGKRKSVVQYFDGTLRNRQTVTKDNSTGNTLVAETIYDMQGRPNLQILPTPTIDNTIQYFRNFNRFEGQGLNEDPAKYFDLTLESLVCQSSPRLISDSGTGRYYSANNPWLGTESKSKFIPDADGYAFTETRYTDDATERISSQGGVGATHQIGTGKETTYYYGKPGQPELDALFGTEVGEASHYFKNMVQDANGQRSISYLDMHGRTIATSLAGAAPISMNSIMDSIDYPSSSGNLKYDLLTSSSNIINGNSIEAVSSLVVAANTVYYFNYELDPDVLKLLNCNSDSICFDCKYDLEISIRSEACGENAPIVRKYNNLQLVSGIGACTASMGFIGDSIAIPTKHIQFSEFLIPGSYVVRKTLTINDSLFQIRKDSAEMEFLCKTKQYLFDSIYNHLQTITNCGDTFYNSSTCQECLDSLGTFQSYKINYLSSVFPAVPNDDQIHYFFKADSIQCVTACNMSPRLATLENIRQQMLNDMIPYTGQYALKNIATDRLEAKYNIFTSEYNGVAATDQPYFRKPDRDGDLFYFTNNNEIDSTIHPTSTHLTTVSEDSYVSLFQRSWTNSLIIRHPEYPKLKYAEDTLRRVYEWMDSVRACELYDTALARGYMTPLIKDPYFVGNYVPADNSDMLNLLTNHAQLTGPDTSHLSIVRIANGTALCSTIPDALKMNCFKQYSYTGIDPVINTPALKKAFWESFKVTYLSFRNQMVLRHINDHTNSILTRENMDTLIEQDKELRFALTSDVAEQNGWDWYDPLSNILSGPDTIGFGGVGQVMLNSYSPNNCIAQKPFWKQRLLQCQLLSILTDSILVDSIINEVLDGLVQVCENSKDSLHPYGASTVKPSYIGSPQSFEEVVNEVFNNHNIQTLPGNNYFCNPFSIDFPKPYGKNPPLFENYSNTLDSCACKRYAELQIEALQLQYDTSSYQSMNTFFDSVYNTSISLILWQGLQKCKNIFTDSCTYTIDSVDCVKPVITEINYDFNVSNSIEVNFTSDSSNYECVVLVFSGDGQGYLGYWDADCKTGSVLIPYDPCGSYIFQVRSRSDCGELFSDTVRYENCCPKLFIRHVEFIDSIGPSFKICSKSAPYYENCYIQVFDSSQNLLMTELIECGSAVNFLFNEFDSCQRYSFVLLSESSNCGLIISDTFRYLGCCPKPVIRDIKDSLYQIIVSYDPQPDYGKCYLYIYDENGDVIGFPTLINRLDSIKILNLDFCGTYSFKINCYGGLCDEEDSEIFYLNGCCMIATGFTSIIIETEEGPIEVSDSTVHERCCPIPVTNGLTYDENGYANIHYNTLGIYSSCYVTVYDQSNVEIFTQAITCEDSIAIIEYALDSCSKYSFIITSSNDTCIEVKSKPWFQKGCCPTPQIGNILITDSELSVYYTSLPTSESCQLIVYDENNFPLDTIDIDCYDIVSVLEVGSLSPCGKYYFRLRSQSPICGDSISVPFYYKGCCIDPKIDSVFFKEDELNIHYSIMSNSNDCLLYIYDENMDEILNQNIVCDDTEVIIPGYDSCAKYTIVIISSSDSCYELTTTYFHDGCCPDPMIKNYSVFGSELTVNFLSSNNYTDCKIMLYDYYYNELWPISINCTDSTGIVEIDPCKKYRFRLMSTTPNCDWLYSDFKTYNGCTDYIDTTCIKIYNPISLTEHVLIPNIFECGYIKPCISCDTLFSLVNEFKLIYPAYDSVPYLDSNLSNHQINQNYLLARFLNFRTGFSKNALDYIHAYYNCLPNGGAMNALCAFDPPLNAPISGPPVNPCESVITQAEYISQQLYQQIKDSVIAKFDSLYISKCLSAKSKEKFYAYYQPAEYHFTLYFYDQAGNLVKTLPPAAVKPNYNTSFLDSVKNRRNAEGFYANYLNNELLGTNYRYNSLNQVVSQKTPDAGESKFYYDKLGRLAVSKNAKQSIESKYSYTIYDNLGRITEVGQKPNLISITQAKAQNPDSLSAWLLNGYYDKEYITRTVYDTVPSVAPTVAQRNLRNRVSYVQLFNTDPGVNPFSHNHATYYSYDIHGNVDTLLQDFGSSNFHPNTMNTTGNRFKKIVYNYDLISGKVNAVNYQPDIKDAFYHLYAYDAENRLTSVKTSTDRIYWEEDARYSYYRHGPLNRMELGQLNVQGVDYAYTLQGWLKGVNSTALSDSFDMGHDGKLNMANSLVAKDAYGFSLNYFNDDFKAIGGTESNRFVNGTFDLVNTDNNSTATQLYNGNIASMFVNIGKLGNGQLYGYKYDQLNRISSMDVFKGFNNNANIWNTSPTATADYKERIAYDPNGNIKTYLRNGDSLRLSMDNLEYNYKINSNQLISVSDAATDGNATYSDIKQGQSLTNYNYDAIGNLVKDSIEGIGANGINWNVYGKIESIIKAGDTIKYGYDPSGNRVSKNYNANETFYVRDASGNVMSVYEKGSHSNNLKQKELHLYGSSRIGILQSETIVQDLENNTDSVNQIRGNKFFELSNHLDNVLVTISDKIIQHRFETTVDYYTADINSANEFYPLGMIMPKRSFYQNINHYRYGFNDKENDNEVKGNGNQQDYGMRIYDTRLGRFLSFDPIADEYPELTPYQFAGNTPIQAKDLDGLEPDVITQTINFFVWCFSEDVEEIKGGQSDIFTGLQEYNDGPQNRPMNEERDDDYTEEQRTAIRKADGMTTAIGGVGRIASGYSNIGAKGEAILTLGSSAAALPAGATKKIAGIPVLKQADEVIVKKTIPVTTKPVKKVGGVITGHTKHGLNQSIGRDGGKGVKPAAKLDAVKNPKKIIPGKTPGTTAYKGKKATIILNKDGKVVTTSGSQRGPQQKTYHSKDRKSGSGSAQRKANKKGFSYYPRAVH